MRFSSAYSSGDERCRKLLPLHPSSADDRLRSVDAAKARPLRPGVLEALKIQNPNGGAQIDRLAGGVAVVTGQQVGLFLGPLYTIYKAAAAVTAARALTEQTGVPAVPIFWLQTEDHDFEEVATTFVPRSVAEPLAITVAPSDGARVAMEHRVFGEDIEAALGALDESIGNLPHAEATLASIRRHYRPGASWPAAFAGWLSELFASTGLLVFDPRHPSVDASAVHRRALERAAAIGDALESRCATLTKMGFDAQVHIRPGAPLSFFHPDGPVGPRFRMDPDGDEFALVGDARRFSQSALLERLDDEPRSFSTSALLRPVLQDSLLPTAAYVGGPGEIDYFAQMGPVYEAFDLPIPLIVPRSRFRIIEGRTAKSLERLSLTADDADAPLETMLARASGSSSRRPADEIEEALKRDFATALEERAPSWRGLDGLDKAHEKTEREIDKALSKLVDKYRSAVLHEDERRVEQVQRLRYALAPHDAPQERIYGLPYFAARYSSEAIVEKVLDGSVPFDGALKDLLL